MNQFCKIEPIGVLKWCKNKSVHITCFRFFSSYFYENTDCGSMIAWFHKVQFKEKGITPDSFQQTVQI